MKKLFIYLLIISSSLFGQDHKNFGYLNASMPQGDLKDAFEAETGFGLGFGGFIEKSGRWKIDYTSYQKSSGDFSTKFSNITLMWDTHSGVKKEEPYFLLGIGWCFSKAEVTYKNLSDSASDNSIVFDIGGGYKFNSGYLELYYRDLKYDGTSKFGNLKAPSFNIAIGWYF